MSFVCDSMSGKHLQNIHHISLSMHRRRDFPMNHARWLDWKVRLYNIYVAAGFSSEKAIPVSHWKILIRNTHAKAYQTKHMGHKHVQNKDTSEKRSQCDSSRFVAGTGQFYYFSSILLTPAYYIHILKKNCCGCGNVKMICLS